MPGSVCTLAFATLRAPVNPRKAQWLLRFSVPEFCVDFRGSVQELSDTQKVSVTVTVRICPQLLNIGHNIFFRVKVPRHRQFALLKLLY